MASTINYTTQAIGASYNQSPPVDDGTAVESNRLKWSNHINKIGSPLLTLIQAINTELVTTFGEAVTDINALQSSVTSLQSGKQNSVLTTRGDIVRGGVAGAAERYAVGAANYALVSNGTDPAWADVVPFYAGVGVITLLYYGATAPTGWALASTGYDSAVRVVETGGYLGGSVNFSTVFNTQSLAFTGAVTLSAAQSGLRNHRHLNVSPDEPNNAISANTQSIASERHSPDNNDEYILGGSSFDPSYGRSTEPVDAASYATLADAAATTSHAHSIPDLKYVAAILIGRTF